MEKQREIGKYSEWRNSEKLTNIFRIRRNEDDVFKNYFDFRFIRPKRWMHVEGIRLRTSLATTTTNDVCSPSLNGLLLLYNIIRVKWMGAGAQMYT